MSCPPCSPVPNPFGCDTSGESNLCLTLSDMIEEAFYSLQMGVDGDTLSADQYKQGKQVFNRVIQHLQTQGLHLSSNAVGYVFMERGEGEYVVEDARSTNEYFINALTADITTGDIIVPLVGVDDYREDDQIGILREDLSLFWSTVVSIDTVANSVEIADAFDGDACEGFVVYNYREPIRPISRVMDVVNRTDRLDDIPVEMQSQQDWFYLADKDARAAYVSLAYYERKRVKGKLHVWPVPQDERSIVALSYEKKLDLGISTNDALDLNQFYYDAVIWEMSKRLAVIYRVPPTVMQWVSEMAATTMAAAMSYDNEVTGLRISVNRGVR